MLVEENGTSMKGEQVVAEELNSPGDSEKRVATSALMGLEYIPKFDVLKKSTDKSNLKWDNIKLTIGDKEILKDISGYSNSGELTALMGPSGAGKSSLLNVLAGRVLSGGKKKIEGTISVNGTVVRPENYRSKIAYVMQEDSIYATSTAREALEFSARLRLPDTIDIADRKALIDDLLTSLGLDHVQNTYVGSEFVRGLSGGEKKRVAIGIELVTNPSMLFLDEPTSGLDSYSALQVVKILRSLSQAGCAVLCTIHQPSAEIFNEFDRIMMLTKGSVMYYGDVVAMPQKFEEMDFPIPQRTNPADYVMLLAQTLKPERMPSYSDHLENRAIDVESGVGVTGNKNTKKLGVTRTANFWVQAWYLGVREGKNVFRDKGALIAQIGVTIFLNLLFGLIFRGVANLQDGVNDGIPPNEAVRIAFGGLTLVFTSAMFGSAQGPLLTFPLERGVMIREYQTGTYGAFPYLLSKLVVEIPRTLFISLITMVVVYWLIDFQGNFIYLTFAIWLVSLASAGLAILLGSVVPNAKMGQEFAPLVLVPQLLFAGVFVPTSQIDPWLRWAQYLCTLKYGMALGSIVEFGDCDPAFENACENILEDNETDADQKGLYVGVLFALFIGFRLVSVLALTRRAKYFAT